MNKITPIAIAVFAMFLLLGVDFQKAYAQTTFYNVTGTTELAVSGNNNNVFIAGEKATTSSILIGNTLNRLIIPLSCNHVTASNCEAFTGNVLIGIWNTTIAPTSGNSIVLIGTVKANTLTETPVEYSFNLGSNAYTFEGNECVCIFYDVDVEGNSNNYIELGVTVVNVFDGANSLRTRVFNSNPTVWGDTTTSDVAMEMIFTGGTVSGIDCTASENVNKLICALANQDSTPLGSASETIGESITNIAIQTGIIDGSDTDPATNGVGYIILAVGLGVFIGILWVAGRGDLTSIPTFVWFIGTIAVVGAITAFGYIDPTFLIIAVIVVIAFAVAKAKGIFTGQGLFAGEQR